MPRGKRRDAWVMKSGWPQDAWASSARVTLVGRRCAMVEGQCGVLELSDRRIRLKTRDGVLAVCGEALCLREMSLDAAMIWGERIESASYL